MGVEVGDRRNSGTIRGFKSVTIYLFIQQNIFFSTKTRCRAVLCFIHTRTRNSETKAVRRPMIIRKYRDYGHIRPPLKPFFRSSQPYLPSVQHCNSSAGLATWLACNPPRGLVKHSSSVSVWAMKVWPWVLCLAPDLTLLGAVPLFCFPATTKRALCFTMSLCHNVFALKTAEHILTPQKLWAKLNLSFLNLLVLGTLS